MCSELQTLGIEAHRALQRRQHMDVDVEDLSARKRALVVMSNLQRVLEVGLQW